MLLFILLIALMLTGMPISIALGLTVLTFVFTMTQVPIESVAREAVYRHRALRDHGHPVLHPGRHFPHPRRRGAADDQFRRSSMVGHLARRARRSQASWPARCSRWCAGPSVATVVGIGSIVLPEMVKRGSPMDFGAAVITVAGSLGILMLPSIPKVIYAIATNTSIGALFVAGLLPGITAHPDALLRHLVHREEANGPAHAKSKPGVRAGKSFRESVWGLMLVVIIIGGIYSGLFTATEAAAMAAVYAFFVSVFVYKAMPLRDLRKVLLTSANMSAMLLYIITNAALFSFILTNENIPHALADWIIAKDLGWVGFLLLANLLLLMAGNFMDPSSVILIMAPILYPAAMTLGINPVHLGILIDVNMEVGLCHPPVGLNLYVASGISRVGITRLTRAVIPWLVTMLVFLVIVTYWPALTVFLPRLLGMM